MRIRLFFNLSLCAFLLSGCMTSEPASMSDVHTGVKAHRSAQVPAAGGLLWAMTAFAVIAHRNGETVYGVRTEYSATGLGWAFLDQAWSFGQQFPYTVDDRQVVFCTSSGCTNVERGTIKLTRAQFENAAKAGFEFKLIGKRREVVGKIPPSVFQQALNQAAVGGA